MTKILIIEDDPLILQSLSDLLKFSGYEVLTASNGFEGIRKATNDLPDLIISDIIMPEKTGLEVLSALKQDYKTNSIPFIFITARGDREDIRYGMSLGAEDYITKPFKNSDILNSIKTRLEKKELINNIYSDKLNEFRKNISMVIPHELRTPLTGIIGFSDLLLEEFDDIDKEEMRSLLLHINTSSKRLLGVISRYITYSQLLLELSDKANFKTNSSKFYTYDISRRVLKIAEKYNRQDDFEFELLEECSLNISKDYFFRIVDELVDNAIKFSMSASKIVFKTFIEGNYLIINIHNFGRGFDKEEISNIGAFVQFKRDMFEQQGIGLGLTLVNMILELFNGKIEIDSQFGSYANIFVKLPLI
jgi:two-component system sensor histidine kinase/response regulator